MPSLVFIAQVVLLLGCGHTDTQSLLITFPVSPVQGLTNQDMFSGHIHGR